MLSYANPTQVNNYFAKPLDRPFQTQAVFPSDEKSVAELKKKYLEMPR